MIRSPFQRQVARRGAFDELDIASSNAMRADLGVMISASHNPYAGDCAPRRREEEVLM
jgi:hypothetical protein